MVGLKPKRLPVEGDKGLMQTSLGGIIVPVPPHPAPPPLPTEVFGLSIRLSCAVLRGIGVATASFYFAAVRDDCACMGDEALEAACGAPAHGKDCTPRFYLYIIIMDSWIVFVI